MRFLLRLKQGAQLLSILLRRFPKDRRARVALGHLSLVAGLLLVYGLSVFVWMPSAMDRQTAIVAYAALAFSFVLRILFSRSAKSSEALSMNLSGPKVLPTSPLILAYLRERVMILTSLVTRGASEAYLQEHPDKIAAATYVRQAQNEFLREHGIWEKLEQGERDFASSPAGSFDGGQNRAFEWAEHLRVLRWALQLDPSLPPLALFPQYDFVEVQKLGRVDEHLVLRRSTEIEVTRDEALAYLGRCLIEQKQRGMAPQDAEIGELPTELHGESNDLIAGAKTIADLPDDDLRSLTMMAFARWQYAEYLLRLATSEHPFAYS